MIRINLLGVERSHSVKPTDRPAVHQVAIGAGLMLALTCTGLGWWGWALRQESQRVTREIAGAELEASNLRPVLSQVEQFEARKAQLQQRVTLIEQLRKGQAAPARVLDQISRSVPDRLWLSELKQVGSEFTFDGFATSMTALSDFVAGIEGTRWFRKPVEIIDSQVISDAKTGDVVRFVVKASYFDPDARPPLDPAKPAVKN